jgi:hypothetical protein
VRVEEIASGLPSRDARRLERPGKSGPSARAKVRARGLASGASGRARGRNWGRPQCTKSRSRRTRFQESSAATSGRPSRGPNVCALRTVPMLAGVPVAAELVRELAERVEEPAATTLRNCLDAGRATFALTIEEREQILRGLEDCPDGLAELRGVLVREHSGACVRGSSKTRPSRWLFGSKRGRLPSTCFGS